MTGTEFNQFENLRIENLNLKEENKELKIIVDSYLEATNKLYFDSNNLESYIPSEQFTKFKNDLGDILARLKK